MFVGNAIAIGAAKATSTRYFNFDGVNDKMDFTSAISLTGNFAVCFWGKVSAEGSWSICGDQTLFASGRLAFSTNTSTIRVDPAVPNTFALDESSADSRWHYFILERNSTGTAPGLTFYRDLVELGNDAGVTIGTLNINRIGYKPDDSGFPAWSGGMREMRIYSRALTLAEKNNLYDGKAISGANLEAYWKMNERSGSSVTDSSGNARTLTIANHTEATFFAKETLPNLFSNRISNGNFNIVSGGEPGTPWVVTDDDANYDVTAANNICRIYALDGLGSSQIKQNSIINKFTAISVNLDLTASVTGSINVGSSATSSARFQQAMSTLGENNFSFITDDSALLIKRTAGCDISFTSARLTPIRNYVVNGDFRKVLTDGSLDPRSWSVTNGAGYTVGAAAGVCTLATTVATNAEIYQSILTTGQSYRLFFYISAITGTLRLYCGSTLATWTTTGWKSVDFVAGGTTVYLTTLANPSSVDISSVIIKRL